MDPDTFEIIVFEYQDLYDGYNATSDNVVKKFLDLCQCYVDHEYVPKEETELTKSAKTIIYRDRSGSDKYKMIQLIGPFTDKMYIEIKEGVEKFYIVNCEDCGIVIPKDPHNNWRICRDCANK